MSFDVILLIAGSGERCGLGYNKVLYKINGQPLFLYSLKKFLEFDECNKVILVLQEDEKDEIFQYIEKEYLEKVDFAYGGNIRQQSVLNGLEKVKEKYVLVHDGARPCLTKEDIKKVFDSLDEGFENVALVTPVRECTRIQKDSLSEVVEREKLFSMKTPQGSKSELLKEALIKANEEKIVFYDDISAIEKYFSINPHFVIGKDTNIKVTTQEDLELVKGLLEKKVEYKIGHSKDTHRLAPGLKMIIGGVDIPFELGIEAHSDGDVLYHAVTEAVIGALGKGDIGRHFSDKDPKFKGISSGYFLEEVRKMLGNEYEIVNIDSTIFIEKPMMAPYIETMKRNIANLLKIDVERVNVKATRGEKVGPIGKMEAVSSEAIVLIKKVL